MNIIIMTSRPENYVPVHMKIAAEQMGHTVRIIDPSHCFIGIEDTPYIDYQGERLTRADIDICIPRLRAEHLPYKLMLFSHLEMMGVYMLNDEQSMGWAIDKLKSQQQFTKLGVRTPKTAIAITSRHIDGLVNYFNHTFPLVLKTLYGAKGVGVCIVNSMPSFKSVCQLFLDQDIEFIVQEYVEHTVSYRIVMLGDDLFAADQREKATDDFRTNVSQGSEAIIYHPSTLEIETARRLTKHFGGHFMAIDYVFVDGDICILEINGSPGLEQMQQSYLERDLCAEIITYCINAYHTQQTSINN